MTPSKKILLKAEELHHSFAEGVRKNRVLKGVSLQVEAGETTAVVGPSGCGKSTLALPIGITRSSRKWKDFLHDSDVTQSSDKTKTQLRNQSIGFIFQFHFLIKELTAIENVSLPLRKSGLNAEDSKEKSMLVLQKLGMESKANRSANKLSGGEQQRVAIARAIVNSPSLILADEPTGNLDSENSQNVFDLLQDLAERDNLGVLIVTHNTDLALKTDNLIRMQDGLIVKA